MERSKSKLILIGLVVLLAAGAVIWLLAGRSAEAPANEAPAPIQSGQPAEDTGTDEAKTVATITFTNEGFSPQQLTVKKGAQVTVKNNSGSEVQFSSDDHPTHLENQGMNLRVLGPGESASFTADQAGQWGFHDHLNDSHTGSLTVED